MFIMFSQTKFTKRTSDLEQLILLRAAREDDATLTLKTNDHGHPTTISGEITFSKRQMLPDRFKTRERLNISG